jgi:hypothetical protein
MKNIVSSIICDEFDRNVGRRQFKNSNKFGMKITFRLCVDYDKEEGYRFLDILIYAENNYVAVMARERWNVIPVCELEYDEKSEDTVIKKNSKGYREGCTEWKLVSFHGSCWRDGVYNILRHEGISHIDTLSTGWYEKIEMDANMLSTYNYLTSERDENVYYKEWVGVLRFDENGNEVH